ncbi:MAG: hypothetical protein ACM3PC_07650, partial [Deltaproteobacteria bacterium]
RGHRWLLAVCGVVGAAVAGAGLLLPLSDVPAFAGVNATDAVLRGLFFANGLFLALVARRAIREGGEDTAVLATWAASALLLAVFVAPFPAARHVMLALPALLLLVARAFPPAPVAARAALVTTAALGAALAISDWRRADVYRDEAQTIPSPSTTWTVGHWGWQWYATQQGLREYAPGQSRLAAGDVLVAPQSIHRQRFSPEDAPMLRPVATRTVPATALDLLRTVTPAGGLYYYWAAVPWTVRSGPVETFRYYQVVKPSTGSGLVTSAIAPRRPRE